MLADEQALTAVLIVYLCMYGKQMVTQISSAAEFWF